MIIGHGLKHMRRMGNFAGVLTCRRCGEQEQTSDHLLFDCEALAQVRFTVFGLVSKNGGFLQENML